MKKILLFLAFIILGTSAFSQADDKRLEEVKKMTAETLEGEGWIKGGGLGLDFTSLLLFNRKVGAGDNKIGIGGLSAVYANYKKGKVIWDNQASLQLAIQKIGSQDDNPFTKSLDVLRLTSKAGYQLKEKWYAAGVVDFQSQLTPSYTSFNLLSGEEEEKMASFLNPAVLTVSPGIDYKHDEHLSLFFAPASLRMLIVADPEVSRRTEGALGVKLKDENDPLGAAGEYKKADVQLGANLRGVYNNKFYKDRLTYSSTLDLFSNYLRDPQNLDVLWKNEIGFVVFKNISFNILYEMTYDHDIDVNIDNAKANEPQLGKRVSSTGGLLIKYNYIF